MDESIRTDPLNHAPEGDERTRTAVCEPSADPVYEVRSLWSEVDCRIEHGADSGGHLEYVRERLARILDAHYDRPKRFPTRDEAAAYYRDSALARAEADRGREPSC